MHGGESHFSTDNSCLKNREIGIRLGVPKRRFSVVRLISFGLLLDQDKKKPGLLCMLLSPCPCHFTWCFLSALRPKLIRARSQVSTLAHFIMALHGQSSSSLCAAWMLLQLKPGFAYRYQPRMPPVCRF